MSKEEIRKPDFILETRWDKYHTTLLTRKLYTHVEKGDIVIQLRAEKGSLLVRFLIWTFNLEVEILKDILIYYLMKKLERRKLEKPILKTGEGKNIPFYIKLNFLHKCYFLHKANRNKTFINKIFFFSLEIKNVSNN